MIRITPDQFVASEDQFRDLALSWEWLVQRWGQATIDPQIREILVQTECGLRHTADLIVARPPVVDCPACSQPHGPLIAHVDVKSTTKDKPTGRMLVEFRAWAALRAGAEAMCPGLFVFAPSFGCRTDQLLWAPAQAIHYDSLGRGVWTGNGSGDDYCFVQLQLLRPIRSLRCWDGWS